MNSEKFKQKLKTFQTFCALFVKNFLSNCFEIFWTFSAYRLGSFGTKFYKYCIFASKYQRNWRCSARQSPPLIVIFRELVVRWCYNESKTLLWGFKSWKRLHDTVFCILKYTVYSVYYIGLTSETNNIMQNYL